VIGTIIEGEIYPQPKYGLPAVFVLAAAFVRFG
jgi:hypothetical protein